jgi:serine kinase of HPr protein (carbohydrate metabolism regulator)
LIRHAGLIARFEPPSWRGVLIEGASGAGKSDLALRALDAGWVLVADDRTLIWSCDGRLYGRAADALRDLMEIRGLGVMPIPTRPFVEISLIAACVEPADVERAPEGEAETLLGVRLPCIRLAGLEASAPAKLGRALSYLGLRPQRAYQAVRARG